MPSESRQEFAEFIARPVEFVKGHGTENDFIVLPDLDDSLQLSTRLVTALCDRRVGLGADGVLRVVRAGAGWFMDYRNADGSIAQMCGNGIRVFGRYLVEAGLAEPGELLIDTRAGTRSVLVPRSGDITVDMGAPQLLEVPVTVAGRAATALSMGNPHVVVVLSDSDELAALDLTVAPPVEPALPEGQNVEFVVRDGERALMLRVHERGVGETRSCGTGVCAAVVATVAGGAGRGEDWQVRVPGGRLSVRWEDTVRLTGPAVLVARGVIGRDVLVGDRCGLVAG